MLKTFGALVSQKKMFFRPPFWCPALYPLQELCLQCTEDVPEKVGLSESCDFFLMKMEYKEKFSACNFTEAQTILYIPTYVHCCSFSFYSKGLPHKLCLSCIYCKESVVCFIKELIISLNIEYTKSTNKVIV